MSEMQQADPALQAGLLMEAAQAQQRLAQGSLERLEAHLRDLDTVVRDETHRTLIETLAGLTVESAQAAEALRRLRHRADLRILVWTVLVTLVSAVVALGAMRSMLPSPRQIEILRGRRAALIADLRRLRQQGAGIDLRRCGARRRLCVRVDRRGPAYGTHGEYLLVEEN